MQNTYTGRRNIWEQKFTYYNPLFKSELYPSPTDPNIEYLRFVNQSKDDVAISSFNGYSQNNNNEAVDNATDTELLKMKFIKELEFNNNNPYKFLKKITMRIDKISLQTLNYYDPTEPDNDRSENNIDYRQIDELLPLKLSINNKEVEFAGADATYTLLFSEYGYDKASGASEMTDKDVAGRLYVESYDKEFELSSIPKKIELDIDFNDSVISTYLKNRIWRFYHYNNQVVAGLVNEENRIDRYIYNYANLGAIRIDGRIISEIDYDALDSRNLNRPKRTVEDQFSLANLEKMLKGILPEKEKPELKVSDVIETLTAEEADQLIEDIKKRREPEAPTDILDKFVQNQEENIYQ